MRFAVQLLSTFSLLKLQKHEEIEIIEIIKVEFILLYRVSGKKVPLLIDSY